MEVSHSYLAFGCLIRTCVFFPLSLKPGSELDNLEEILDDLQNSQLSQLFPDTRPGAPAGSVDKQAIINDLMQITGENSPSTPVGTQKPAMRISQSSESELSLGCKIMQKIVLKNNCRGFFVRVT